MLTEYEYKVIEILDEYSILINYGLDDGAEQGEKVRVIAIGPEVRDPDSDVLLGTLDAIKSTLNIVTPYESFSLCRRIKKTTKNVLTNPLSQFQTTTTETVKLNVDMEKISYKKIPEDKTIKIGDKVEILG